METNPTTSQVPESRPLYRRLVSKRALRIYLFALVALITLVALYHAEENWRGARAWNNYKRERIAAGESMDWTSVVPPRVPDEQNFAMTPFLAPMFDFQPGTQIQHDPNAAARSRDFSKDFATGWSWSNEVDVVALANAIAHPKNKPANGQPSITDRKEAARVILQNAEQYSPVLEELRRASERPYVRFNIAYDIQDKISMILPHLYMLRNTTRLLAARAAAELVLGQTDQALADTKLGLYLGDTPKAEPTLVSQLVRHACLRVTISVVNVGLREHQWSDAQVQQLEAALEKIDLISGIKLGLDAESKMHGIVLEDLKATSNRLKVINHWAALISPNAVSESRNLFLEFLFWVTVPRGWIDFEQLNSRRGYLDKVNGAFDLQTQSLDPEVANEADKATERLASSGLAETVLNHKVILKVAMPFFGRLATKTSLAQAELKMTQIACALERYRLAHNQYPDELNALTPQFTGALPKDPIKGGEFKYRRTGDAFLLYSIGWNATDDGGKTVMTTGKVAHGDANQGDWVWGSAVSF
jgi:hypothetical protein